MKKEYDNKFHNCYNTGSITSNQTYSGGLLGKGEYYSSGTDFYMENCYFNATSTFGGSTIAKIKNGTLHIDYCYVNDDNNATTDNSTTTFDPSTGELTTPQTINGDSRTTLYDALHNWRAVNTAYSDWKEEIVPHLAWEPAPSSKRR